MVQRSVNDIYGLGVAHNKFALPLPDGTYYPDYSGKDKVRWREFLSHFDRVRDKEWQDCKFLDLGCSEGSTTLEISQTGATAYGVEGRADGIARANVLRDIVGFEKTHFSVGNVVDDTSYRPVDGIFNAGVLYHLQDPIRCLEQCAANARQFVYVDTGHMPRSEEERQKAKFVRQMGRTYKVGWRGLTLDLMEFAEPNVPEVADGIRRGTRSGIGNSISVWLSHASLIEVMAKLGFPYHETVADVPQIPRLRTCFFRALPRPLQELGPLAKPLPKAEERSAAILNAKRRDIAYLQKQGRPVIVVGREPMLQAVLADLRENKIAVGEVITVPGSATDRFNLHVMVNLLRGKKGFIVAGAPGDYYGFCYAVALIDKFDYVFTSFAMSQDSRLQVARGVRNAA